MVPCSFDPQGRPIPESSYTPLVSSLTFQVNLIPLQSLTKLEIKFFFFSLLYLEIN